MTNFEHDKSGWKPLADLAGDFDYLRLECEEAQDTLNIIGLLEYFFHGPLAIGGEYELVQPDPETEAPQTTNVFVFWLDSTKSRRDDIFDALDLLAEYLSEGTPIRKTDRAGVGTKGTRKYQPVKGAFQLLAGSEGGAL